MKKTLALFLAAMMLLSLAACSSGNDPVPPDNSGEKEPSGTTEPDTSKDPEPATGDDKILRMGRNLANVANLDVWTTSINSAFDYSDCVMDRLFNKDPVTLELVPNLLEDFPTVSDDRLTYTFKLKEGVMFHDGTELTSEDVEFTFNYFYAKDTASTNTWVCEVIKGCQEMMSGDTDTLEGFTVIDDYSFSIEVMYPYSAFESVLAVSMLPILPKQARLDAGDKWGVDVLIGTGPFILDSFMPTTSIDLRANKDYHGGAPAIDGITVRQMDESTALMEWEAGSIDVASVSTMELLPDYEARFPDNLLTQVVVGTVRIQLNNDIAPLDNVNVRKALAMATDKEQINQGYYNGRVITINGILPDGIPGFDAKAPDNVYDPEGAKQLLADEGYPEGITITATIRESSTGWIEVLQILKAQYEAAGITLEIEQLDSAGYLDKRRAGNIQFALADWYADYIDGDMYMYSIFYSDYAQNFSTGFRDDWWDEQVLLARTMEGEEKADKYAELDAYLVYTAYNIIPLHQDQIFTLVSDRVDGLFMKKDLLYNFTGVTIN